MNEGNGGGKRNRYELDWIEKKVQNFVVGNRMHVQFVNLYGVLAELF